MKLYQNNFGFTLMEVVVSVTIFASVVTLMLGLFNQTLRIYRRTDAIRQATQNVRSSMEFLTKEVRNGQVYYGVSKGGVVDFPGGTHPLLPCPLAQTSPSQDVYGGQVEQFALINVNGERACVYWQNENLYIKKEFVADASQINPATVKFKQVSFLVFPGADPYSNPSQKAQPSVSISVLAEAQLPSGERYQIPYQTSISTYNYDIPTQ